MVRQSPIKEKRSLNGVTKEGQKIGMTFQIANVTKPLGSVRAMLDAGNRVVFDRDDKGNPASFIMNKKTKATIPINERNAAFVLDLWTPAAKSSTLMTSNANRFQALEEYEDDEGFVRRDGQLISP